MIQTIPYNSLRSLPAKMRQSLPFIRKPYWVHELNLMLALCWLAQKKWYKLSVSVLVDLRLVTVHLVSIPRLFPAANNCSVLEELFISTVSGVVAFRFKDTLVRIYNVNTLDLATFVFHFAIYNKGKEHMTLGQIKVSSHYESETSVWYLQWINVNCEGFSDNKGLLFPWKVGPVHLMRGSRVRNFVCSLSKENTRGKKFKLLCSNE